MREPKKNEERIMAAGNKPGKKTSWRRSSDDDDDLSNREILPARKQRIKRLRRSNDNRLQCLPHDVVVGNILNRLPVKSLMRFNCVCKLWYESIHIDPYFASSHLNQSFKNPSLMFYALNVELNRDLFRKTLFLSDDDHQKDNNGVVVDLLFRELTFLNNNRQHEILGSCNGLVCLSDSQAVGCIMIMNPSRPETLFINYDLGIILCHGFGFDSLTNEYKVVFIVSRKRAIRCFVFTLGKNKNSWRETSTRPPIGLPPPGTRLNRRCFYRSALFCGGALFWRSRFIDDIYGLNANENTLLSFDLHEEKFQAIPLPLECFPNSTKQEPNFDPLIELRGNPCAPYIEEIGVSCDHLRQHFACKVHLHILVDKVEKVWIKETFDVHISSPSLHPPSAPSCCFYGTSTTAPTLTRIFSSSDGVLLYWFNGEYLQFYNLHTRHLKLVKCSHHDEHNWVLKNKNHICFPYETCVGGLSPEDYHRNHHVENLFSLQTLIPKGAPELDYNGFVNSYERGQTGFLFLHRKSSDYFYILN